MEDTQDHSIFSSIELLPTEFDLLEGKTARGFRSLVDRAFREKISRDFSGFDDLLGESPSKMWKSTLRYENRAEEKPLPPHSPSRLPLKRRNEPTLRSEVQEPILKRKSINEAISVNKEEREYVLRNLGRDYASDLSMSELFFDPRRSVSQEIDDILRFKQDILLQLERKIYAERNPLRRKELFAKFYTKRAELLTLDTAALVLKLKNKVFKRKKKDTLKKFLDILDTEFHILKRHKKNSRAVRSLSFARPGREFHRVYRRTNAHNQSV